MPRRSSVYANIGWSLTVAMTPERFVEVERLFHEALERPPHERAAFLHDSSAGDDSLRHEVESLLDHSSRADAFLEGPAAGAAALLDKQRRSKLIGRFVKVEVVRAL